MADDAPRFEPELSEEDELFSMANLFPKHTGLPRTVWIGPKGGARHDARIKVSAHPDRMDLRDAAVVSIRPEPRLLLGELSPSEFEAIAAWVRLNQQILLDHWNGEIDSFDLAQGLQRI